MCHIFTKVGYGTPLVVQWLRLHASTAEGSGSTPGELGLGPECCAVWTKKIVFN